MKKKTLILFLCFTFIFFLIFPFSVQATQTTPEVSDVVSDNKGQKYIIKLKESGKGKASFGKQNKKFNAASRYTDSIVVSTLTNTELEDLRKDPSIAYIEKDSIVEVAGETVAQNVYQLHVPEVHKQGTYGEGIKVAVLDTGIQSSSELNIAGGVSFVENDAGLEDHNGHGTFMAGLVAASHNQNGLLGVAPEIELYNVKVLDGRGNGYYSAIIQGIEWAIENEMDIVSMSFAGAEYSAALEEAMNRAYDNGVLLVASAGNKGEDKVLYPAKFDSVIAVGAVDAYNQLAPFSNKGDEVELVAPGVNVAGLTLFNDNYITMSGTSVAVPQVAGVAALVKESRPQFTNQQVRVALTEGATQITSEDNQAYHLVNAAKTLMIDEESYVIDLPVVHVQPQPRMVNENHNEGTSVSDSVYHTQPDVSINATDYPIAYDQIALHNVNLKGDQAPFRIDSGGEQISTLTGELSIQNTDLTLPGRNGLSFSLSRVYNSSDAQLYDEDVGLKDIFHYRIYPWQYVTYDRQNPNGTISYAIASKFMNQVEIGFNNPTCTFNPNTGSTSCDYVGTPKYDYYNFGDYQLGYSPGHYWWCNIPSDQFNACYESSLPAIEEYRQVNYPAYYGSFYGPSYNGNYYRMWSTIYPTNIRPPLIKLVYLYTGYFNKTIDQTYSDKQFPIGKGWSWNISSIESKNGKRYLHLANQGTYEIDGSNKLVGYPWKDLTLTANNTVVVNGERSAYDLKSLDNYHQYFTSEGKLIQISDAYGNTIQFKYGNVSPYGKVLTSITDAIGNTITISYTSANVTLTSGNKTVTYSKQSLWGKEFLASVQDPAGRKTQYSYSNKSAYFNFPSNTSANQPLLNPYGLLTTVTHPTGATTTYTYESSPITRSLGSSSGYNQSYRIYKRHDQIASTQYNALTFSYSGHAFSNFSSSYSFSTTVNDGLKQTTYAHSKQFVSDTIPAAYYTTNITETAGSLQRRTSMTYDQTRRLPVPLTTSQTHVSGSTVSTAVTESQTYDDYGNVLTATDPNGVTTSFSYDTNTRWLASVNRPLNATLKAYIGYIRNAQGSLTQITVKDNSASGALRGQTDITYDSYGNPTKVTVKDDTRNLVTNYEYSSTYGNAFVTKQTVNSTNIDGTVTAISEQMLYDKPTGNLTQYTDGNGYVTTFQFDKLDRVTKGILPSNGIVSISYDDANNKVTTVDPSGLTAITQWNGLGWKVSEGISGSGTLTYGYDTYGRMTWNRDARNNQSTYGYDAWNRLMRTTYPDNVSTTVSYDNVNRTVTTTDAESNSFRETYDQLGRVLKKEWLKSSGPITLGTYTYDYAGSVITSVDGKANTTKYSYDVLNRLLSVTDPENRITSYSYSLSGLLKEIQYPDGNKLQKQYDELGRLIREVDPMGQSEKLYYDANSNLIKVVDRKGQVQNYTYNNRNFLMTNSTASEIVNYGYDAAGRRLTMQDTTGTTSYTYDSTTKMLRQVTFPDGKSINYSYDLQGNRATMTDPFGYTTAYGYDTRNRLTGVGPAVNNWDASYTYKLNDLLATVQLRNGVKSNSSFDGANLIGVTQTKTGGATINAFSYTYDNNGNQIAQNENGSTRSFGYDKLDRILTSSQNAEIYAYDLRGNRQSLQTEQAPSLTETSYLYDERNRLTKVQKEESGEVTYRYNGDGILYERTEEGITTRYYTDGAQVIAEATVVNGVASLKARYIRGNGLVARVDTSGNKAYYVHNGHGDVVGLTDSAGNILNSYSYDIWGKPIVEEETIDNPFRYSGEFWDESTGLQYLRARWYDPSMGRFINEDSYEGTLTNPLTLNLYTYVGNNPLIRWDPSGNSWISKQWNNIEEIYSWENTKAAFSSLGNQMYSDAKYVADGLMDFGNAALNYVGPGTGVKTAGVYVVENGKGIFAFVLKSIKGEKILNIGAGENIISGAINIDIKAAKGIDVVADVTKTLPYKNSSIDSIVSINPFGFNPINASTSAALKTGGTFTIVGQTWNKYFNNIYTASADELKKMGYELVSKGAASDAFKFGTKTTNGNPIAPDTLFQIILKKL